MNHRLGIAVVACLPALILFSGAASAQGLPNGYGQVQWGMQPKKAVEIIDSEVNAPGLLIVSMKQHIERTIEQYRKEHPDMEPPTADEFEDQFNEEDFRKDIFFDELSSYGEKPQYYADLLSKEIALNSGEGVIAVEGDDPALYYLFMGKKLWKVVVVHSEGTSAKVAFGDFLSKLERRYGKPTAIDFPAGTSDTSGVRPLRAIWDTGSTRLVVRPEQNGYREIYTSKAILSNIEALRKEGRKKFEDG